MHYRTIARLLGVFLLIFSSSMLTPLIVNVVYQQSFHLPFISAFTLTASVGACLAFTFRHANQELKIREGFLIVALFWFVLCCFGALPFLFVIKHHHHHITDAMFEAVSGFTTTGATIINHLDPLPKALLFYRQQLEFLGGMGIVVLAVAVLPMLGVGGLQLYRAEMPGPMKESKLTPRITQTAKALWGIYLLLSLLCILSYKLCGMKWFEAICEGFATVSTGGFSIHDNGFAYYHSTRIEIIASIFMLLSAINFSLHFLAFKKKNIRIFWQDEECRAYIIFVFLGCILASIILIQYKAYDSDYRNIIMGFFHVISFATTTGFAAANVSTFPTFLPYFLLLCAIIGGCAASTSGGIKMIRCLLVFKQAKREFSRLLHPNAIFPLKFGKSVLPEHILESMWGFISVFIALDICLVMLFMAIGNDFTTSFSAINAMLTNSGAALGSVIDNYAELSLPSKWILMFAMIAGRLEIFSLLILFTKQFWQR